MGGDSFGMAAPNDHCHGPCTMSFPRFQCVERQRLLTASFLLQKEAKDCIGKLFLMGLLCTCLACLNSTTTLFLFSFQFLSYFLRFNWLSSKYIGFHMCTPHILFGCGFLNKLSNGITKLALFKIMKLESVG